MPQASLDELRETGFCVLKAQFAEPPLRRCREAFWPILLDYVERNRNKPNRGENRHFLPMPFAPPCFAPEFFFDSGVLSIVREAMGERIVADQWGCDAPIKGSTYQGFHADYQRPLFPETPDLALPIYMLAVSFGLSDIRAADGPMEIAPGTHNMPREEALRAVASGEIKAVQVALDRGDVLIRQPWALHRGTPNLTDTPRALITIRYVRRWYADESRDVQIIPLAVWRSLTAEQQSVMRFPVDH